jgi:hypothetical protein
MLRLLSRKSKIHKSARPDDRYDRSQKAFSRATQGQHPVTVSAFCAIGPLRQACPSRRTDRPSAGLRIEPTGLRISFQPAEGSSQEGQGLFGAHSVALGIVANAKVQFTIQNVITSRTQDFPEIAERAFEKSNPFIEFARIDLGSCQTLGRTPTDALKWAAAVIIAATPRNGGPCLSQSSQRSLST